jgi:methylmalonyl-CoA/ethylmalonyl-CoA epimerase
VTVKRRLSINHVGLAVPSIERFLNRNELLLGALDRGPLIHNDRQRVRELTVSDGHTSVELIEPLDERSPISGFLQRNPGGGLVHVAFEVDDLDQMLAELTARGARVVVPPTPDIAFGERRIAFVVLDRQVTELIERAPHS